MKKVFLMTMAALSILFTQCKKTEVTPAVTPTTENQVTISLNVGGSKVDVDPIQGTVAWEEGDIIYVASHGAYVGTLTYDAANTEFKGTIADPTVGEPLFFYYLGNQTPTSTPTIGTTTVAVSIADQHEKFPVIAAGESNEDYKSSVFNYTSTLRNKCGLVKFSVAGYTGTGDITVKKMNNKVTVDFSKNLGYGGFTYEKENGGAITLNKQNDVEYWAILLPQGEVTGGTQGDAYSSDDWAGTYGTVPAINNNSYETAGVAINIAAEWIDFGQGVKWALKNLGATNSATPESWYGDYYAWGATTTWYEDGYAQENPQAHWKSDYSKGYSLENSPYFDSEDYYEYTRYNQDYDDLTILDPKDDAAHKVLGGTWHMPTAEEWQALFDNNTYEWVNAGATYNNVVPSFKAVAAGYLVVKGGKNSVPLDNTKYMFLPAAGFRDDKSLNQVGSWGKYWSSSLNSDYPEDAYHLFFGHDDINTQDGLSRYYGCTVRPVR